MIGYTSDMNKPVILTGLRANNDLHIGHFFGALMPIIDVARNKSDKYEVHLFVPDLHSFTTPIDHSSLQAQIMQNLRIFVASGLPLDNSSVHIYRQSYIPAHSEMTVILNSFTGMGQMERMTQYKDKSSKLTTDAISVGLFDYPVLMASDILLYGAKYVPVGDDQSQHLEFTRDIAERMNGKFGSLFDVPEPVARQHEFFGHDQGLRIKDLVDPNKKMSKSDESTRGIIFLTDSPEVASQKIMSATTDSVGAVRVDQSNQPGVTNLLSLLALTTGEDLAVTAARYAGSSNYGELKKDVADKVGLFLTDFQARLRNIDDEQIRTKLVISEEKMRNIAGSTLLRVQTAVGLRPEAS